MKDEEQKPYRSFPPRILQQEPGGVQQEQDVDQNEQMVSVPERVEAHEAVEGPWQLDQTAAEPVSGEQEGDNHEYEHDEAAQPY